MTLLGPASSGIAAGPGGCATMAGAERPAAFARVWVRSSTMVAVMPGTRSDVAAMGLEIRMPGAEMAMVAVVLVAVPMPGGLGVVAVAAMMAVVAVVAVVPMPGAVVAVAAVVVRNEDEGVRRNVVPNPVPAAMAARMRPPVARTRARLLVQYRVEGSRGNPEENRLAGRKVMAAPAGVTVAIGGERRLGPESGQRKQRRERRRAPGRSCRS